MTPDPPRPRDLVDGYEASIPHERRRRDGAHYTPEALARTVVRLAFDARAASRLEGGDGGAVPASVLDPSCGAGGFLLAAADELLARGEAPERILTSVLVGVDIDGPAIAAARAALVRWGEEHEVVVDPADLRLEVGDAMELTRTAEVVIGNPPFQSQLASATARDTEARERAARRVGAPAAYADTAALHLLHAVDMLEPGGVLAMVQPTSLAAARDTAPIRERISERAEVVALWTSDALHFDAAVHVFVPVLVRRGTEAGASRARTRVLHADTERQETVSTPAGGETWSPMLAAAAGVPRVDGALTAGALGDLASATAGFRDEFYALADAVVDGADDNDDASDDPKLVSVGMIDPLVLRWGSDTFRVGGQTVRAPVVDVERLAASSPRVHAWAAARRVPKVLVATQTKIVEAVVDPSGSLVPLTPVVSVEPHDPADVWRLAAVLSAPATTALVAARQWGSGRSSGSLRIPARVLVDVPLPCNASSWEEASQLVRTSFAEGGATHGVLVALGRLMNAAYGMDPDGELLDWWLGRLPRRRTAAGEQGV